MKFSVLMSLYYKEKPDYLMECLVSLEKQTYPANEIILVFDGEVSLALEQVVQKFVNKLPLVIVRLPNNVGLGKALNIGLTHCQNDWIFRMDTDDICVPNRFEKQVDFIKQYPETVILGGQIAEFGNHLEDILSYRYVPTTAEDILRFAQKRCPFNHMTVAYQKKAVIDVGGYQDLQEDYYLWIKLIACYKNVANLPDILVYARIGNGMINRRRGIAQAKAEWRLFKLKRALAIQHTFPGLVVFLLRVVPRLLPSKLLHCLYKNMLRR